MKVLYKQNLIVSITLGVITAFGLALLLLGVATTMILDGKIDPDSEMIIMIVVHFLAMFVGSFLSGAIGMKPLISCTGVLFLVLLLNFATTIFAYSGEFQNIFSCLLPDAGGCTAAVFLSTFLKNKRNHRTKKYRAR